MKRIAALVIAAGLLLGATGCGADSESYAELKSACINDTRSSVEDGSNPVIKSYVQLENVCSDFAKEYEGKTIREAYDAELRKMGK